MQPGGTLAGLLTTTSRPPAGTTSSWLRCRIRHVPFTTGSSLVRARSALVARRVLLHLIGETAQHAGHGDIIRESLDGAKSMG